MSRDGAWAETATRDREAVPAPVCAEEGGGVALSNSELGMGDSGVEMTPGV